MARPLRIEQPGLTYHVWARGVGRMTIYRDDRDRQRFLTLLSRSLLSHHVECHAYCLMDTHYHLVITTQEANLSHTVQQINCRYALWWNHRHSRPGHVFQGRFGSQIIDDDRYLLTASRYVVRNPVRGGLVASPEQWRWSSYRATAGLDPSPAFLQPETLWRRLACDGGDTARRAYREFVALGDVPELALPSESVVGDETFKRRFHDLQQDASAEVTKRERRCGRPLGDYFAEALSRVARAAAIQTAYAAGYAMTDIARVLGVHYSTVSRVLARVPPAGCPGDTVRGSEMCGLLDFKM